MTDIEPVQAEPRSGSGSRSWATVLAALLLTLGLVSLSATGAFAVYTWAWRDTFAQDHRRAAALARVIVGQACPDGGCAASALEERAQDLWQVRISGSVNECFLIATEMPTDTATSASLTKPNASTIPCTDLPLRQPWLSVAVAQPLSPFLNAPLDDPTGLEVDVIREVARRLGISEVRFTQVPQADILDGAFSTLDVSVGRFVTPQERPGVQWSQPYFHPNSALVVRRGDEARVRRELASEQLTLGVVRAAGFRPPKSRAPRFFPSSTRGVDALLEGRIDGFVVDINTAVIERTLHEKELVIAGVYRTPYGYSIAAEEDSLLLSSIDAALREMRSDGTLATIQNHWLSGTASLPVLG